MAVQLKPLPSTSNSSLSKPSLHRSYSDESDLESQTTSSATSDDFLNKSGSSRDQKKGFRIFNPIVTIRKLRPSQNNDGLHGSWRGKPWVRVTFTVLAVLTCFGLVAAVIYVSFVGALIHRLAPPSLTNGLQHIVDNWTEPNDKGAYQFTWRDDFSRDIIPKKCHSHNDYWRKVPLYDALAAGCVSVEADIWSTDANELLVAHSWHSTNKYRTLKSLYLEPLKNIFVNRNVSVASTQEKKEGVFDTDPNASIVLLIDIKNDGKKTWPILLEQLRPLHAKGWLSHFNGEKVVRGPLTVVGTGNAPFNLVDSDNDHFIFFDAPLDDITNPKYTTKNSYYASVKFGKTIGFLWFNKFSSEQTNTLKSQIKAASDKAFVSRYWDTPAWPISLRSKVWFTLTDLNVGVLNVDDLISVSRWNWNWCTIAGFNLCRNN